MITLKEGKPQEIEVSVSYKGIPYEKEVSFGVLADGELVFNENYTPENGTITVMLPPGDTTKRYSYVLESDDGFTKEQPIEVYAPKMRDIEAKKQYLDIDIDKTWDENTDALLGAYNEVYAESRGKVDELDKGLKDVRETSESKAEEIYEYILEDVVPIITELKSQQESTKSSHESILEEHSSLTNEIKESLGSFETRQKIDEKLANIYRDMSDVRSYTDSSLKPLLKEIKTIRGDTSLQLLGRSLNTLQQSVKNELEEMKKTMSQGRNIQPFFSTIAVAGQNTLEPQGPFDALTFAAGSNVTLTTNRLTRTVTIASTGGGGGGAFIDLTDVPSSYAGQAGLVVKVNATEDGLEFGTGGTGSPGGSDTQVQFNDGGSFGGDTYFTWNKTSNTLTLGLENTFGNIKGRDATTLNTGGGSIAIQAGLENGSGDTGQVFISNGNGSRSIYVGEAGFIATDLTNSRYDFFAVDDGDYHYGSLNFASLTTDRTYTFQDGTGTLAFLADITGTNSGTNTGDQTITNSSDATSHTVTLSASGGSVQLIEGTNITLTTGGTSSAGTVTITASGGSGDVTKVGTPVNNQVGVWTGDGTLEGDAALLFDTTTNSLIVGVENVRTNYIRGADATTLNADGGGLTIIGGAGNGSGDAGEIDIQTGDFNGQITVSSQPQFYGATGQYVFYSGAVVGGIFDFNSIATTDKTFTFPNTTGTIALTSDIKPLTTVTDSGTSLTLAGVTTTIKTYVFTGASTATWTLQAVSGNTDVGVICKNRGTANINLNRAGSDNIYYNSAITSLTIYPGESYTVVNDGTYRLIV